MEDRLNKTTADFDFEINQRLGQVQSHVSRLVHLKGGWISPQTSGGWGFVIGDQYIHIDDEQLLLPHDDLVLIAYKQATGTDYESKQDLENRIARYQMFIDQANDSIMRLENAIEGYEQYQQKLREQISNIKTKE
ncbi:MAG: hypothetical protein RLP44_02590 [Aggregatilineales bacterium]